MGQGGISLLGVALYGKGHLGLLKAKMKIISLTIKARTTPRQSLLRYAAQKRRLNGMRVGLRRLDRCSKYGLPGIYAMFTLMFFIVGVAKSGITFNM